MSSIRIVRALLKSGALAGIALLAACGGTGDTPPRQGSAPAQPSTQTQAANLPANAPVAVVYKDPNCSCCKAWVEHMRQNGFRVETNDVAPEPLAEIKAAGHVPANGKSCHTARVGQYVIEGHVPADLVKKLLSEHPADIAGLTVPGMVTGSPGMEGPSPQHYDVIAFTANGQTRVYASR
jgi:hypothetical protein